MKFSMLLIQYELYCFFMLFFGDRSITGSIIFDNTVALPIELLIILDTTHYGLATAEMTYLRITSHVYHTKLHQHRITIVDICEVHVYL